MTTRRCPRPTCTRHQRRSTPTTPRAWSATDNGITGTSGSYRDNTFAADRNPASPIYKDSPFLEDEYDLTDYAGQSGVVLRFSYYTDPGLDRPGWFIDDLDVKAGAETIYSNDFTNPDNLHVVPGGCGDSGIKTANQLHGRLVAGRRHVAIHLDHAYYLELRDRSGFDFNGRGQADRGAISGQPGAAHRVHGRVAWLRQQRRAAAAPALHRLAAGARPRLRRGARRRPADTAQRRGQALQRRCLHVRDRRQALRRQPDAAALDPGDWIDNFSDPASDDGFWHFAYNCLSFDVTSMSGTDTNESLPSNLAANATITALAGCAPFSYAGAYPNTAPIADAQAKPNPATVNQPIIFDASGSSDDMTPASQLIYQWDWDNNGTYDQTGQTLAHSFSTVGAKTVKLRVTDRSNPAKSSTDTVVVTVTGATTPLPDLRVTAQSYTPTTVRRGNVVTFRATVSNTGNGAAAASTTAWFRTVNGVKRTLGTVATPAIPAHSTRQVQITYSTSGLAPGRYKITIRADWNNTIPETDGDNNTLVFYLRVLAP